MASIDIFIICYVFLFLGMSGEIIKRKECGQEFDDIHSLKEHERSEQEDKELQNKVSDSLYVW